MSAARTLLLASLTVVAVACGGGTDEAPSLSNATPSETALSLFALAARNADDRELAARFVSPDGLDEDPDGFFDQVEGLSDVAHPRVVASEALAGLDEVVVDLEGERPGPTLVAFMVVTAPAGDGTWRVRFFGGPGVQWPRYPIPRGDATTTSPAPDAD